MCHNIERVMNIQGATVVLVTTVPCERQVSICDMMHNDAHVDISHMQWGLSHAQSCLLQTFAPSFVSTRTLGIVLAVQNKGAQRTL